jgi:hypothetical protein
VRLALKAGRGDVDSQRALYLKAFESQVRGGVRNFV